MSADTKFTEQTLRAKIEEGFWIGPSSMTSLAATGEPYVRIGCQEDGVPKIPGTVDEGRRIVMGFDEETAWWSALNSFQQYAEGRGQNLYWRESPVLEWNEAHTACQFYLRLLVSKVRP